MRLRNILAVGALLFFPLLAGCVLSDSGQSVREDNVAYFIPPEVSTHGSSTRKKPTQPKSVDEIFVQKKVERPQEDFFLTYEPEPAKTSTYVVQTKDTIYGIARKFRVLPSAIMNLNNLDSDSKLVVGQKLKVDVNWKIQTSEKRIPPTAAATLYIVQEGDSLSKIAKAYGVSLKTLKEANGLQSDRLKVGQKLDIPAKSLGKSPAGQKEPSPSTSERDSDGRYTVKNGDSLGLIAKHFGVTQMDLQNANAIENPNKLRVGQKLIIPNHNSASAKSTPKVAAPAPSSQPRKTAGGDDLYTIKSGDSVSQIAQNLNVSEKDLMELNNLSKTSLLQVGKKLLIPPKKVSPATKSSGGEKQSGSSNFFENFEEIPMIEIAN
ncbi:MAG: LysM peptidoglycan-binding domain-containing protein [Puniceicoccales bacterium]|jgi:LysM repeat protein|nr:LysM peptidoglycan-binding domain-containing protein [Puniceicoccales bacterium]